MMKCVLNVTDQEYNRILPLNHDAVVWKTTDRHLLHHLQALLGRDVVEQLRKFDECRIEKHDDQAAACRVQSF